MSTNFNDIELLARELQRDALRRAQAARLAREAHGQAEGGRGWHTVAAALAMALVGAAWAAALVGLQ